jgi:hypothetical protein
MTPARLELGICSLKGYCLHSITVRARRRSTGSAAP